MADFTFYDQGSVVVLVPTTNEAWTFVQQNVRYESWQLVGDGIAMEPRMAQDITEALVNEGFTVRRSNQTAASP